MKPLPPKPAWYLYAFEAQKIIDRVRPSKSGKKEDAAEWDTYLIARHEKGYEGSEKDWHTLLWRNRQNKRPWRQPPD